MSSRKDGCIERDQQTPHQAQLRVSTAICVETETETATAMTASHPSEAGAIADPCWRIVGFLLTADDCRIAPAAAPPDRRLQPPAAAFGAGLGMGEGDQQPTDQHRLHRLHSTTSPSRCTLSQHKLNTG